MKHGLAMDAPGGAHRSYDAVRRIFELDPSSSRISGARYRSTIWMSDWPEVVRPDDRDDPSPFGVLDGKERQWIWGTQDRRGGRRRAVVVIFSALRKMSGCEHTCAGM